MTVCEIIWRAISTVTYGTTKTSTLDYVCHHCSLSKSYSQQKLWTSIIAPYYSSTTLGQGKTHLKSQVITDTYRRARRIVIAIFGGTVVLIGILMLVLPGPAIVVIPAGLAILSLEFAWARRWLRKIKRKTEQTLNSWNQRNKDTRSK